MRKKLLQIAAISIIAFVGCGRKQMGLCGMCGIVLMTDLLADSSKNTDNNWLSYIKVNSTFADTIPIRKLH